MTTRRDALKAIGGLCGVAALPGLALAQGKGGDKRLVFVFLRGGLDGLSAVPAYGDPDFARKRGELAPPSPGTPGGALKLDGTFALNPLLPEMHKLYTGGELLVLHAVATPYRDRSHFDAQNLLENGTTKPYGRDAGWLNVALGEVETRGNGGMALGPSIPLIMRGPHAAGSWSPSLMPAPDADLLDRLGRLYRDDPLLAKPFATALTVQAGMSDKDGMRHAGAGPVLALANAAGKFLSQRDGPRVATIDFGGWDTHASQVGEFSALTRNLRLLDRAIGTLKASLGPVWQQTAVIVVTEFGRTVAINGSRGTDHGTGAAAFAFGGAVRGGRVIADWPGLADRALHEGRDLKPTLDLRALFKAALAAQLGVAEASLETRIFPDSRSVKALEGVFG